MDPTPPPRRRVFYATHEIHVPGAAALPVRSDHDGKGGLLFYDAQGWLEGKASGWVWDVEGRLLKDGEDLGAELLQVEASSPAVPSTTPAPPFEPTHEVLVAGEPALLVLAEGQADGSVAFLTSSGEPSGWVKDSAGRMFKDGLPEAATVRPVA
jgi:hypothetical protein